MTPAVSPDRRPTFTDVYRRSQKVTDGHRHNQSNFVHTWPFVQGLLRRVQMWERLLSDLTEFNSPDWFRSAVRCLDIRRDANKQQQSDPIRASENLWEPLRTSSSSRLSFPGRLPERTFWKLLIHMLYKLTLFFSARRSRSDGSAPSSPWIPVTRGGTWLRSGLHFLRLLLLNP